MSADEFVRLDDNACTTEEQTITNEEIKMQMMKMMITLWKKKMYHQAGQQKD